jgi:hypothetical protein
MMTDQPSLFDPTGIRRPVRPRRPTQRDRVLDALRRAGDAGVCSAWGYKPDVRIPRMAAVVFNLRAEGFVIDSTTCRHHHPEAGSGKLVTYVLRERAW